MISDSICAQVSTRPFIAANMIVGKRDERFLTACLESLKDAVDLIVINDNSEGRATANLRIIHDSALYKAGKVIVITSGFEGFAACRNKCLDYVSGLSHPDIWVLYCDCDEVHTEGFARISRELIPNLPETVGIVEAYVYQFHRTDGYYSTLDHRKNLLFRFNAKIRWRGDVHEWPYDIEGDRVVLPYRYYHYGYVASLGSLNEKWAMYSSLGDSESTDRIKNVYALNHKHASEAIVFRHTHPSVVHGMLDLINETEMDQIKAFDDMVRRVPMGRFRRSVRYLNNELKVWLRGASFMRAFRGNAELVKAYRNVMSRK